MRITGKYEKDSNFITVYCDNTVYTITKNTDDWDCVKVGQKTAMGQVLTQEAFDKWASECTEVGTFELSE